MCRNAGWRRIRALSASLQERLRKLRDEKRRLQAELDSLQFGDNHVTSRHIRQVRLMCRVCVRARMHGTGRGWMRRWMKRTARRTQH